MKRRAALLLLLSLFLAACGKDTPPPPNPGPSITSISPTSTTAGGFGFTLTVNGTGFIASSVVRWNGSDRMTSFGSATQVTAPIPASDVTSAGTAQVTVFNPAPGGGTSSASTFTINATGPANDNFSNAAVISATPFTASVSTTTATTEATDPTPASTCASGANSSGRAKSVWYRFTAGSSGNFTADTFGSNYDTILSVWTAAGSPPTFTSVACNDDSGAGFQSQATFGASAGTTYYFMVTDFDGAGGSLVFNFNLGAALAVTTTRLPDSTGGKTYDVTLGAIGGTPPYTWSLSAGSPPATLSLGAGTGRITGAVTAVGSDTTANFTVQVSDSGPLVQTDTQALSILVRAAGPGRNDTCTSGSTSGTTAISNGTVRASLSPYGDVDVYSFQGTGGTRITIETFAQRLNLDGNAATRDSFADTVVELLDSSCTRLTFNDDIATGTEEDSEIVDFQLPGTGLQTFFIRVRDFRGDGRPDLIYELRLTGAN